MKLCGVAKKRGAWRHVYITREGPQAFFGYVTHDYQVLDLN